MASISSEHGKTASSHCTERIASMEVSCEIAVSVDGRLCVIDLASARG
jgi:hypothetical protein